MSRLNPENLRRARELIGLYPEPRSALLPILHIVQEQDGWLTPDGMQHVAELLALVPAEVYGTASFYDMFFTHPVGRYLVSICTNLACMLNGAYQLMEHAEQRLGVPAGATTSDGEFTLEEVECIALCGAAPCLTVNWRFFGNVSHADFDRLVDDLRTGRLADRVPPHGTLNRVRRKVPAAAPAGQGQPSAPPEEEGAVPPGLAVPPGSDLGVQGEEEPARPRATATAAQQARAIRVAGEGSSEPDAGGAGDAGEDGKEDGP
jgi:NADH-quinone oxidoreductase E subunit